ncbi:MAG: Hpt domain-containing protein [Deltaproteobacteria bacterium]|nr:Hpt domain-containing protein [Deltaproteobacteria bacterium]
METERIVVHADPDLADDIPWYMGQVREYIEAIGAALEKDDFETIRDAGHRMKGSGETFGFDAVSEIGKSIEMAAKELNTGDIKNQVQNLSEYIDRVEVVYEEAES